MPDTGYRIPDAGYRILDAGCLILDAGYWGLEVGTNCGFWIAEWGMRKEEGERIGTALYSINFEPSTIS